MNALPLLAVEIPGWAAAIGGALALPLTGWLVVAGRRVQRQDTDGAQVDETARTVHQHAVTDATMAQAIAALGRSFERVEGKIDKLAEGHAENREARVRIDTELSAMREANAARDARVEALEARVSRESQAQIDARHALRAEIQGWVTAGIADALEVLRALASTGGGSGGRGAARRTRGGQ